MVGAGDGMGVPAQMLEHILWAAEGWFGVDHPIFSEQWTQPGSKDFRLSQEGQVAREAELAVLEGGLETSHELAAKDTTQHSDGEKEARAGWHPVGLIERQSTGGGPAGGLRVEPQLFVPRGQHAEETHTRPQKSGGRRPFPNV